MTCAKYEIEKFSGNNNFTLWKRRMKDLLIQQKVQKVLSSKSKMPKTMKNAQWEEMDESVASAIQLNLSDEVLNNINMEDYTCHALTPTSAKIGGAAQY